MDNINIDTPLDSSVDEDLILDYDEIRGDISPIETISGTITYGIGDSGDTEIYNGEYTVIPKAFEETVLQTRNKKMLNNVTVREVPYFETSNTSGGLTVYIAGQIEF